MRVAVLADIHSNFQALEAVLQDAANFGVQDFFSLGDNIGYGPEPEKVVVCLRQHQVTSVMGNHELALFSRSYYKRLNPVAQASLDINRAMLSAESLAWLQALPPYFLAHEARFVHGCPPQSMTVYLVAPSPTQLRRIFAHYQDRLCFVGHTHDFGFYVHNGGETLAMPPPFQERSLSAMERFLILPGSVGQPRDAYNRLAKYLLWNLEDNTVIVRMLDYDVQTTTGLLAEYGFPSVNAKRLR